MRYALFVREMDFPPGIMQLGCSSDPAVTRYGPAHRDNCIIHYVLSGKGWFNGNSVHAGEGFVLYPGDFQHYESDPEDPWAFVWIISSANDGMKTVMKHCRADVQTQIFSYDFISEVHLLYDYIKFNHNTIISPFEAMELVGRLMKHHDDTKYRRIGGCGSADYARIACQYLQMNYAAQITVDEITRLLGISQPYLYKVFKAEYGISPKQYLTDLRISQGKLLLSDTGMTISEVGVSVGFDDVMTFSKFFSKHAGMPPTRYREMQKQKKTATP